MQLQYMYKIIVPRILKKKNFDYQLLIILKLYAITVYTYCNCSIYLHIYSIYLHIKLLCQEHLKIYLINKLKVKHKNQITSQM